ncbi:MAG: beta-ketoacyl-ACP synthase III [Alphaproteobacteria bacterium]
MQDVYINSLGVFLPGAPVANDQIEDYIGKIGGAPSRYRALVLRQNRIRSRHYAVDTSGAPLHSNANMAAAAIKSALGKSEVKANDIAYLATSTTIGDLMVPGLASHVHAELGIPPVEVASFQSVCASALMAMKSAWMQLRCGEHDCAAVSGSEFASRYFRPGFYEETGAYLKNGAISLEADFLRFTLSDGAGAAILENRPNDRGLSLKINWINLRSFADRFRTCMVAGGATQDGGTLKFWGDYGSPSAAMESGALMLFQDFDLMRQMLPVWVSHYLDLIDEGNIDIKAIDHVVSHYSAHALREEVIALLKSAGAMIDEEKWFSNLYTKGNTGTASIFILLEELFYSGKLKKGEKILCHVPESGRAMNGFMMLEVV